MHKYPSFSLVLFLIIGSGVAGMCFALKVAEAGKGKVALICKTTLDEANTAKAQGGIASVTNLEVDNFEKHIRDTMIAGDYISDPAAVEQVVKHAPEGIRDLGETRAGRHPRPREMGSEVRQERKRGIRPAPRGRPFGIPHPPPCR